MMYSDGYVETLDMGVVLMWFVQAKMHNIKHLVSETRATKTNAGVLAWQALPEVRRHHPPITPSMFHATHQ
jgi:hypothetical protein